MARGDADRVHAQVIADAERARAAGEERLVVRVADVIANVGLAKTAASAELVMNVLQTRNLLSNAHIAFEYATGYRHRSVWRFRVMD